MKIEELINHARRQAMTFETYNELFSNFAASGKTSGPDQSPAMIDYTKLNFHRSKRVFKTAQINPILAETINENDKPVFWTLLTETWCGDAANSVPVIGKLAQLNPLIDLKIVFRDENLDLMDQFLTNNGRSIPKLIATDENGQVLFDWGPRPQPAQEIYDQWKKSDPKPSYQEFHITLQTWYQADGGASTQAELLQLLEGVKV
jgi:thiol-disulfide isomerase/thioredoxin